MPTVRQPGVTTAGPANIKRGVVLCKQSPLGKYKPLERGDAAFISDNQTVCWFVAIERYNFFSRNIISNMPSQNFNFQYKFSMLNADYITP